MLATIKGNVTIGVLPFSKWDAPLFPGITATNNEKNGNLVTCRGGCGDVNRRTCYQLNSILIAFLVVSLPVAHADTLNLIYDANGNLVTGDGFYREYNSFN
ncbi:hypothetical protein HYU14_04100 [Candidatus Woesearchaeota archaeon]|nr:hypothetical protein [Candidatus Woesearchaeota archaeon]